MTSLISTSLVRRASVFAAAILLAAGVTHAQSNTSNSASASPGYSSSQSGLGQLQFAELAAPALPGGSGASSGGASAGQYGSSGGHGYRAMFHHWTFEAGGGFNAPVGNDTDQSGVVTGSSIPVITWGGNFTVGGGLRFNKYLSVLAEYQFIGDKLPAALVSAINNATGGQAGITSGNTHINSITGSPVIDLTPKRSSGAYLVGGWGWYHKSTNFQAPEIGFDQFGDELEENVTVASFSSNQWGGNAGLGLYHRFGNVYGDTGHTELFAEARYTFIHTPPATQANGLGTTGLIPVTIGLRF